MIPDIWGRQAGQRRWCSCGFGRVGEREGAGWAGGNHERAGTISATPARTARAGYLENVSTGVVPDSTATNSIPAAAAALASTSESPTYTPLTGRNPQRAGRFDQPVRGGLAARHIVAAHDCVDEHAQPVPFQGVPDPMSLLRRHDPEATARAVKRLEHPSGAREEGGAGNHDLVGLPRKVLEKLAPPGLPLLAREDPERRRKIESDRPADGVRRGRGESQLRERMVAADHDAPGRVRQREVEVEKHGAGVRYCGVYGRSSMHSVVRVNHGILGRGRSTRKIAKIVLRLCSRTAGKGRGYHRSAPTLCPTGCRGDPAE